MIDLPEIRRRVDAGELETPAIIDRTAQILLDLHRQLGVFFALDNGMTLDAHHRDNGNHGQSNEVCPECHELLDDCECLTDLSEEDDEQEAEL